jgi:small subunit ribosomal protein S6
MNIEAPPRINLYEGMFLLPQSATGNLQEAADHIKQILERSEAEILSFRKWDERRLAYEIKGNKRGVYFLVYFKADATKLATIDRDIQLSEQLLRAMITRAEHLPQEVIDAAEGRQELEEEIKARAAQGAGATEATGRTARVEKRVDGETPVAAAAPRDDSDSDSDEDSDFDD